MNTTMYDGLRLVDETYEEGGGVRGVLTDGKARWDVHADAFVDADALPRDLDAAIPAGAEAALNALASLS